LIPTSPTQPNEVAKDARGSVVFAWTEKSQAQDPFFKVQSLTLCPGSFEPK
jgi:hypothetical protein